MSHGESWWVIITKVNPQKPREPRNSQTVGAQPIHELRKRGLPVEAEEGELYRQTRRDQWDAGN